MQPTNLIFAAIAALGAAFGAWWVAGQAVGHLEESTQASLQTALAESGDGWVEIEPDGLIVHLTGTAPDETARLRVLETLGREINGARLRDKMIIRRVEAVEEIAFSLQILRNGDRVSLIGLVPDSLDTQRIGRLSSDPAVTEMLETVDRPAPDGWQDTLNYALDLAEQLEQSKLDIMPGEVAVAAFVEDAETRDRLTEDVVAAAPEGVVVRADITSPRPVITPFRFALTLRDGRAVLSDCAAETTNGAERIQAALLPLLEEAPCKIGLGAPSEGWADAVVAGITALKDAGGGRLVVNNAEITYRAPKGLDMERFEEIREAFLDALPPLYSLDCIPPPQEVVSEDGQITAAPRFAAERLVDGRVAISGVVADQTSFEAVLGFAQAKFGFDQIENGMSLSETVPEAWPQQILGALDALSLLHDGKFQLTEDGLDLDGVARSDAIPDEVRRLLARAMPKGNAMDLQLEVDTTILPPVTMLTSSPEIHAACAGQISDMLELSQFVFAPGSAEIEDISTTLVDDIAAVLENCPGARFEVAGHTDSQGRESSNMALSQRRADAVVDAMLEKDLTRVFLSARGYGEEQPIADNQTEEGRARNRRIAFTLIEQDSDGEEEDQAETNATGTEETAAVDPEAETSPDLTATPVGEDASDAEPEASPSADAPEADTQSLTQAPAPELGSGEDPATEVPVFRTTPDITPRPRPQSLPQIEDASNGQN